MADNSKMVCEDSTSRALAPFAENGTHESTTNSANWKLAEWMTN